MTKVAFYSFKGGSGRTLAAANVACALAQEGHSVGCIDFDIESAGLRIVFRLPPPEQYVQDYLLHPDLFGDLNNLITGVQSVREWSLSGELKVISADLDPKKNEKIDWDPIWCLPVVNSLMKRLEEDHKLDYLLIDSRSGISNTSLVSVGMADILLIFFSWGRQHQQGTQVLVEWLDKYLRLGKPDARVLLVASRVPKSITSEDLDKAQMRFGKPLIAAVYECEELKIEERLLVLEDPESETAESYKRIAKTLQSASNTIG